MLAFIYVSALTPVIADEYSAETDFFGDSPMVLTVSRMQKPLSESPASVTVIDREMIRNSGARELVDVFRMVPGFIVGFSAGHTPTVTYHGLGHQWQRQLQVLIDGRSVFIPSFGGVPWSNLPIMLQDIQRIEITRGPNAVTYGANAFIATINIITRHAAEDSGGMASYARDIDEGSFSEDIYVRYGNSHDDFDWRISAGRERDDGYDTLFDGKTLEKLNLRADFLSSPNTFWTLQTGLNQAAFGRGDGDPNDVFREEDTRNSFQSIKFEHIQDKVTTTALLTLTSQNVVDNFDTPPLNSYLDSQIDISPLSFTLLPPIVSNVNFDRKSERIDFELYQNRKITDQLSAVYGGSTRHDVVNSFYAFNDHEDHKVNTHRQFSSVEWKPREDFIADFGLMVEDTNFTDTETSARLSLIKAIDNHHIRLVSSSAKRNPILWELFGETQFIINLPPGLGPPLEGPVPLVFWRAMPDVIPETIYSNELGMLSELDDQQLTTDIKLFSYRISDHITETEINTAFDPITGLPQNYGTALNGGTTSVDGVEMSLNFSPRNQNYRLYGGLSRVKAKSFTHDFSNSFPDFSAFVGGNFDIDDHQQWSFNLYAVDDLVWTDTSLRSDDYFKLDSRYQYMLDRRKDIKFELIGYNLMQDYAEYKPPNLKEASVIVKISGRF